MPRRRRSEDQDSGADDDESWSSSLSDDCSTYEDAYESGSDDDAEESNTSDSSKRSARRLPRRTERRHIDATANGSEAGEDDASGVVSRDLSVGLTMKSEHSDKPMWITPDGTVVLERFSPYYARAYDLLAAVAEPQSRTEFMQIWHLTETSLHAASSIDMTPESIVTELDKFCKNVLDNRLKEFIREHSQSYGKLKLVLREGSLFVESTHVELLREVLRHPTVRSCRIACDPAPPLPAPLPVGAKANFDTQFPEEGANPPQSSPSNAPRELEDHDLTENGDDVKGVPRFFRVDPARVEELRKAAHELRAPLMDEFDYKRDASSPLLAARLRGSTNVREYQEKCLNKMFGEGRARSGVFVLPCGAGKTLTGIVAICTMRRSAMVLCNNNVAVEQWKRQLELFCEFDPRERVVCRFTARFKEAPPGPDRACVVLSTYSMMATTKVRRSEASSEALDSIFRREWGLIVLDEVHVAPAKLFRRVLGRVKAHCKLGLTATLVREDGLIHDLSFLIGPKLYEADWMDLTEHGFLARVMCQEVRCPMTGEFMAEYLASGAIGDRHLQHLVVALNPIKVAACEYLVHHHEALGDKILVFCDNVLAVEKISGFLKRPALHGATAESRRMELLSRFQNSPSANTLVVSKVADMALDLPEANVIVQVSSHFGSRRQEAQRFGRLLRPKRDARGRGEEGFNAFFYALVVPDTRETMYAARRQRYLKDQGYAYNVVSDIEQRAAAAGFVSPNVGSKESQWLLLTQIIVAAESGRALTDARKRPRPQASVSPPPAEASPERLSSSPPHVTEVREEVVRRSTLAQLSAAGDLVYTARRAAVAPDQ